MIHFVRRLAILAIAASTAACGSNLHALLGTPDNHLYVGDVAQPEGPVVIRPTYSFRFVEKWRITHAWIQGTGVRPCRYPGNVFARIAGYPSVATEKKGPMFERNGKVYSGGTFEKTGEQIVFYELRYQLIGEAPNGYQSTGYTPFCGQVFKTSRNGIGLWIIKPDPAKGTDDWIAGAESTQVNGRTWLVKKVPPQDLRPSGGIARAIEYWTLKIPQTPYWLHLRFSGSLDHSVQQHRAEHEHLLGLFHRMIESVKLEPITPVDASEMPPFVLMN
jgi:hypothetical protein